jgi:hypothetical protein
MKINIKHILEGITNSIFVKEEVEKIANERYEICKVCPHMSANNKSPEFLAGNYYSEIRPDEHCTHCACNIHAKNRSLHTSCPVGKWDAVATPQEAAKVAAVTDNI